MIDVEITLTLKGVDTDREDILDNLNHYIKMLDKSNVDSISIKDNK